MKRIALVSITTFFAIACYVGVGRTSTKDPAVFVKDGGIVIDDDKPQSYLLVSYENGKIIDVAMAFGKTAKAKLEMSKSGAVDVFRVEAMGTFAGRFKPCTPDPNADKPDCTPTGGQPPIVPPRFRLLELAIH